MGQNKTVTDSFSTDGATARRGERQMIEQKTGFRLWQLILPVGISVAVIIILMKENITADSFREFRFTWRSVLGIVLALVAWCIQNSAMAHRYYSLAHPHMSRLGALRVTLLADFASAVTPSAVGGSSVLFLFLGNEGVNVGRATAITISGLFLDELFMSLVSMVLLLSVYMGLEVGDVPTLSAGLNVTVMVLTVVLSLWTSALYVSLFHKSSWVGNILVWLTSWRLLRKWRTAAEKIKGDLMIASREMKEKSWWYWTKLFGATILSWVGRFSIACMLVYGFSSEMVNMWIAFGQQVVIWLLAIIIPTPGGSGFAEYMFQVAYEDFFPNPGIAIMVALVWRMITSFSYLLIGPPLLMYQMRHRKSIQE